MNKKNLLLVLIILIGTGGVIYNSKQFVINNSYTSITKQEKSEPEKKQKRPLKMTQFHQLFFK